MATEYWTECEACETETQVLVVEDEEIPQYCRMCGFSVDYEEFDND